MYRLYPDIKPHRVDELPVEEPHSLYFEESGNPRGLPVVCLHHGPGLGSHGLYRRLFDPERYRIVLFDQRGSGKSNPFGALEANTTWHTIADLERLRQHLSLGHWLVFGDGFGATLALAYAQRHSERVMGLLLRSAFLCRPRDVDWLYRFGASQLFPEAWKQFIAPIPLPERDDLPKAYAQRLDGEDELERLRLARAWNAWETTVSQYHPHYPLSLVPNDSRATVLRARLRLHYMSQGGFLEPAQLLEEAQALKGIPGIVVHGRFDILHPLAGAFALQHHWPEAELRIVPGAGNSVDEPGLVDAAVRATRRMAKRLA
ncbi:MAG: prolyl aminopeptidase [Candidatus Competibacterales bacterium]